MYEILLDSPILVLFIIVTLGYLLGKVRIGSFSLGIAAVLFAGLAVSAIAPELALPSVVYVLGLVLFVYTIGLASGPGFFKALKKEGLMYIGFAAGILVIGAIATVIAVKMFGIEGGLAVGMYTGAFTCTPALASALELLGKETTAPVAGYSLAYPLGVMCVLAVLTFFRKFWKIDHGVDHEARRREHSLYARTVRVTRKKAGRVAQLAASCQANVTVSRISTDNEIRLANPEDSLKPGTLITIVGNTRALNTATDWLGETVVEGKLELDNTTVGTRRVFLSNRKLAGLKLSDLDLQRKFDVVVTRVRRGDVDMVANPDIRLELGDRIKTVGTPEKLHDVAKYMGDSYKMSSEFDVLTFAVGILLGILLGLIPIPLPGGITFSLGATGGALIVALILGAVGRTGRFVWQLPYGTNMTIRQVGLVLFLAGIGSRGGGALKDAMSNPSSLVVILVGAVLTTLVTALALVVGYKFLKIPYEKLSGMTSSIQTNPTALAQSNEYANNDEPNIGYASVYPVVIITKIILVQIIILILI